MAKVKYSALLIFTNQLSAMITANLPLAKSLDGLSKESMSRPLLKVLRVVKEDVESGVDFGYAISQHPNVFDSIYINMVKAGMATGHLDRTLKQLTEYMEKAAKLKGKLKSAFAYPIFMLCFLAIVFMIMVLKILPTFEKLFSSFGDKELPVPTQVLMRVGEFVQNNYHWIFGAVFFIVAVVIFFKKQPTANFIWDRYKLKIPLFGDLMKKAAMGKFFRAFAVLTQNEVLIVDSLALVSGAGYNKYLEHKINQAAEMIEKGLSIAVAFQKTEFFPEIVVQMITSGEETGQLGILLENAANFYDDQVDDTLGSIVPIINPFVTIVIGGTIGMMLMAIFLPIFDLGSAIQG